MLDLIRIGVEITSLSIVWIIIWLKKIFARNFGTGFMFLKVIVLSNKEVKKRAF